MTDQSRLDTVTPPVSKRPILVDDILRPMWTCLKYSGFYHGILPGSGGRRLFNIIRYISTVFTILLVLCMAVWQLLPLVFKLTSMKNVTELAEHILSPTFTLMAIVFVLQFYGYHRQFVDFFSDWRQMEMQFLDCCNRKRVKRITMVLNGVFFYYILQVVPRELYFSLTKSNAFCCLPYYEVLEEKFGFQFLLLVFIVFYHFIEAFFSLGQVIPSVLYYQAGCMIENLELELKNCLEQVEDDLFHSRNQNAYQIIWKKYETIHRLVKRTDDLFGFMLASHQFNYICSLCFGIHRIIYSFGADGATKEFLFIIYLIVEIIGMNWLASHLKLSGDQLKNTLTGLCSEKWQFLSAETRDLLEVIFNRMDRDSLAACPLDLYTIDPTNLLSLTTLIVSYVLFLSDSVRVEPK